MESAKSLSVLRAEYLVGLQNERRRLQQELSKIEKLIARITDESETVDEIHKKRRRLNPVTPVSDNPRNDMLFPEVLKILEEADRPLHYSKIYDQLPENCRFGGTHPDRALYARLKKEAQKNGAFKMIGSGIFMRNRDL